MARAKSEFLSSFGTAFEVFKAMSDAVLAMGGDDNDLRRLLSDSSLGKQVAEVIMGRGAKYLGDTLTVTLYYPRTFEEMVAAGHYDWVNQDITSGHFPITREGETAIEVVLVHLNKVASTADVLHYMGEHGLAPAPIEHLFAVGEQYPDLQRKFPIVALGSVWRFSRGLRFVAGLCEFGARRDLGLRWFECDWRDDCRFLAVRK